MSTRLGVNDKGYLLNDFNELFGRIWNALPCPFNDVEIVREHNAMVPVKYIDMAVEMEAAGYNVRHMFRDSTHFTWQVTPDEEYEVSFTLQHPQQHDAVCVERRFMLLPVIDGQKVLRYPDNPLVHAWGDQWDKWCDWARPAGQLVMEMHEAWETVRQLVNMASTAGQIKRMVPELLNYLPKEKAEALRAQKRSSSIPYEWSAYDRKRVQRMLFCAAKCYLLPKGDGKIEDPPNVWVERKGV